MLYGTCVHVLYVFRWDRCDEGVESQALISPRTKTGPCGEGWPGETPFTAGPWSTRIRTILFDRESP